LSRPCIVAVVHLPIPVGSADVFVRDDHGFPTKVSVPPG
jgi:hypothetical protein